jgi:hypothetical protein
MIILSTTVGRRWYVEIVAGTVGAQAFVGTQHLSTGNQIWDRVDIGILPEKMTEQVILDELYAALLAFLERRTAVG